MSSISRPSDTNIIYEKLLFTLRHASVMISLFCQQLSIYTYRLPGVVNSLVTLFKLLSNVKAGLSGRKAEVRDSFVNVKHSHYRYHTFEYI